MNANTSQHQAIHYIKDKHFFLGLSSAAQSQRLESEQDQKNVLQAPPEAPRPS